MSKRTKHVEEVKEDLESPAELEPDGKDRADAAEFEDELPDEAEEEAGGADSSDDTRSDDDRYDPQAAEISTEAVVEAILLATDSPLPAAKIAQITGTGDAKSVKKHIAALNDAYAETGRSFRIEEIAKGFQILTLPEYNPWLSKVLRARSESKLSGAAMETLAIIAYKQPVLRADVEAIRGVAAGDMINRLREMNLVKIVGRAEEVGRPMLYGTTKRFLEVFGLASLDDLPKVEELRPPK